jgi:hypothetical protein
MPASPELKQLERVGPLVLGQATPQHAERLDGARRSIEPMSAASHPRDASSFVTSVCARVVAE